MYGDKFNPFFKDYHLDNFASHIGDFLLQRLEVTSTRWTCHYIS